MRECLLFFIRDDCGHSKSTYIEKGTRLSAVKNIRAITSSPQPIRLMEWRHPLAEEMCVS